MNAMTLRQLAYIGLTTLAKQTDNPIDDRVVEALFGSKDITVDLNKMVVDDLLPFLEQRAKNTKNKIDDTLVKEFQKYVKD